ncbi:MAG: hypothetical protein QW112_03650 [Candidatus Micrarchaeia archaeon]
MQMALIGKEETEEEKKRKEKERKKEEALKAPEILEKKESIEKGLEKETKPGELKTVSSVEHPEFKAILETGQIYTKREPVVREVPVVRLADEERKRTEAQAVKRMKEMQRGFEEAIKSAGAGRISKREAEKLRQKELRELQKRERELTQREARKRAMREKRDIQQIAEELRRKGIITSIRSRIIASSRREQKKLKLIKKLLSKIKTRMK